MRLILKSRITGEELGVLEATATGVIASNGYAHEVMDAREARGHSPRDAEVFLSQLHASLRYDSQISVGLIPSRRKGVPRNRARKRMLEQHYLQDLGWAGVFRGRRIAYWVAPGDDVQNPSHRFQHDEAVTAAKLPTDFDELESWGDPYTAIAERRQTDPLPPEVRATLLSLIESDVRVAEREEELLERRLHAHAPRGRDGAYTPAQGQNARGFARKDLALELGIWPTEDAEEIDSVLRPRRRSSPLSYAQRVAVERRAVAVVVQLLEEEGWTVRDVGATHSYDLHCSRSGNADLFVEVKGTTQPPGSIVLTANEVELARRQYPDTALYVVHSISLSGDKAQPDASGGIARGLRPWNPDPDRLRPTAFVYRL
jgi:hypothetical protein